MHFCACPKSRPGFSSVNIASFVLCIALSCMRGLVDGEYRSQEERIGITFTGLKPPRSCACQ